MAEHEETLPSGLIVVRDEENVPRPDTRIREITREGHIAHRLIPEQRKQRREDNKAMRKLKATTRKRKKHGRQRDR